MTTSGIISAAAAVPLAQASGAEIDRARHLANLEERAGVAELQADRAAGIGELDAGHQATEDRDADGRRFWELSAESPKTVDPPLDGAESAASGSRNDSSGLWIDLTG